MRTIIAAAAAFLLGLGVAPLIAADGQDDVEPPAGLYDDFNVGDSWLGRQQFKRDLRDALKDCDCDC